MSTESAVDAADSSTPPAGRRHSPDAYRWFPGWTMLGISAAAQFMSAPGQSYSVAAFKQPMLDGLKISETDYSLAYGCATLISGFALPGIGRLIDAWGARRMLPLIAALLGAACIAMSFVSSLTGLYAAFAVIRSLGQGALSLVAAWIVGEWFERRRGLATSLSGLGGSLSVMVFPLINLWLIAQFGWQSSWAILGVAVWGLLVLPGLLLIRDRPEDLGLLPDGDTPTEQTSDFTDEETNGGPVEEVWTWREAIATAAFWKLAAVPATSALIGTGLVFHQVSILAAKGIEQQWALGLISIQALVATLCAPLAGYLTDRFENRFLLALAMLFLFSAASLLIVLPSIWFTIVYAILAGMHGSIIRSTGSVVWLTYFGRLNQGAVRGLAFSIMILAAAAGPLPLAVAKDQWGRYEPALMVFLVLPVTAAALVWSAHRPERPRREVLHHSPQ